MKTFNKIISIFITMIIMFNVFSFNASADDDVKSIYRESSVDDGQYCKYSWWVDAKSDGIIDISISIDHSDCNDRNIVKFNNSEISLYKFDVDNDSFLYKTFTEDYDGYNIRLHNRDNSYSFSGICTMSLKVKENFINNEIAIFICGCSVNIPFGDSKYLTYSELKLENEKLRNEIESLTNKVADVDNDGTITIADALTTLQYYTRNTLLGENITWEELLNKS